MPRGCRRLSHRKHAMRNPSVLENSKVADGRALVSRSTSMEASPASETSVASSPLELRSALLEEGGRAFLLVLRRGAEAEIRGFQKQSLTLAGVEALVRRLK